MDVVTSEHAQDRRGRGRRRGDGPGAGAADIRRDGGVARMSDPVMIRGIQETVTIR